jgi:hypothetical protein
MWGARRSLVVAPGASMWKPLARRSGPFTTTNVTAQMASIGAIWGQGQQKQPDAS